jgi:hypothetical protein
LQHSQHLGPQLVGGSLLQPDQHIRLPAEVLHNRIAIAGSGQLLPDFIQICRLLITHLDQRAPGKIEAEIEPAQGPMATAAMEASTNASEKNEDRRGGTA